MAFHTNFQDHCLRAWHRQIASRDWSRLPPAALSSVAIGYMRRNSSADNFIEVENLAIVVLQCDRPQQSLPGIRLAGFGGSQIPWGVRWGGENNTLFDKDLGLPPISGARGRQLELARPRTIELGLQLSRELWRRTSALSKQLSRQIRLPHLWAGFLPSLAMNVSGDGPELIAMCHRQHKTPGALMEKYRRMHGGLVLYPLNWVSHLWQSFDAVFADLDRFPKFQIIRFRRHDDVLHSYCGASEFDFRRTRFLPSRRPRRRSRRHRRQVAA